MLSINTYFPAAFPILALAHFVALLSPGPDFFLLTGYGIKYRLRGCIFICLGIAIGNAVYIGIAIYGWSSLRESPLIFASIEIIGAIYLFWLGYQLVKSQSQRVELQDKKYSPLSIYQQFILGISSAILNPKNALFYMSLMVVILGQDVSLIQQITCGIWMFWVVFFWDLLIVGLISHPILQNILNSKAYYIERFSGVVLIGFSLGLFFNR